MPSATVTVLVARVLMGKVMEQIKAVSSGQVRAGRRADHWNGREGVGGNWMPIKPISTHP